MKPLFTAALIAVPFIAGGCHQPPPTQAEKSARPAKLFEVSHVGLWREVRFPAVVEASEATQLTFQVPGVLNQMSLSEGELVAAGTVLAQLDLREFQNTVAKASAEFTRASREYDRAEALAADGALPQSVLDQRRATRDTAEANLDDARKRLSDATLRAPFDAIVADVHIERFETVAAQQPIVTLQSDQSVEAVVQVPASIVVRPENATPKDVVLELDAARDTRMPAALAEYVALADPATQTFEVRFSFEPPKHLVVLPGMTGVLSAKLPLSTQESSALVPYASVIAEAGETFVWVVDLIDMIVQKRVVILGPPRGKLVTIESGLSKGETIVSAGGHYLYDGARICSSSE